MAGGTLLPRIFKGLREFKEVGLVEGTLPRIHAAQPAGSAPVIRALEAGLEFPDPVKPDTIAKSLAIGNPADGFQVVKVVKQTGGTGAMVSDAEILDAIQLLARTEGIFTEPAGGTTLAATRALIKKGVDRAERVGGGVHHRQRLQDRRSDVRPGPEADADRPQPGGIRARAGVADRVACGALRDEHFPVFLKLQGRRVVFVGGGTVAAGNWTGCSRRARR